MAAEVIERMSTDVEAEQLFFEVEGLGGGPGGDTNFLSFGTPSFRGHLDGIKESALSRFEILLHRGSTGERLIDPREHSGAVFLGEVEGSGLHERLQGLLVDGLGVDA